MLPQSGRSSSRCTNDCNREGPSVGQTADMSWEVDGQFAKFSFMDRLSKIQILVGATAALVLLLLRSRTLAVNNPALPDGLEGLSFILCTTAILTSGKRLRQQYQSLGSEKRIARQTVDYMEARQSVRWWSYIAALVIASLASDRFNLPVLVVVGTLAVVMPVAMIVADQASGWTGSA